jgi:hypothetical protein
MTADQIKAWLQGPETKRVIAECALQADIEQALANAIAKFDQLRSNDRLN